MTNSSETLTVEEPNFENTTKGSLYANISGKYTIIYSF